ncbi:hypothetical protein ABT116_03115 [Streptomyces sp. NPDC002130]|uniref:hypothetical protein n=1 Tax=Streptomyces sp. NPDC002130 TaxID=3155568 RepID=UPI003319A0F5
MAWSAALPDAASRLPRTAAGWRALQLALMVGGLLVLGLLWGERASAENGAGVLPEGRAEQVVSGVPAPGAGAGDRLVGSVGDAAESASKGPARTRAKVPSSSPRMRSQSQSPERPSHGERPEPAESPEPPELPGQLSHVDLLTLPDLRDLPDLPDLPGLPGLPGLSTVPGDVATAGRPGLPALPLPGLPGVRGDPTSPSSSLPTPVTADPQPGGTTPPVPYTPVHGTEPHTAPASPQLPVTHANHGRNVEHTGHLSHTGRHTGHLSHVHQADHLSHPTHPSHPSHPRPSSHAGLARADHSPGGRPDGVLGNRSVADSGSCRHGDAHAVTPSPWAPLRLVPGVAAPTDVADARRTHRDMPLFPG